jgi:hypothetical protein
MMIQVFRLIILGYPMMNAIVRNVFKDIRKRV